MERLAVWLAAAPSVCLLLDYDGTLVPLELMPDLAKPDPELVTLLTKLAAHFEVHIVSGRERATLQSWLGGLPITLWAEHALWRCGASATIWSAVVCRDHAWTNSVRLCMLRASVDVPGSFVEDKGLSLAWHYRLCAAAAGSRRASELRAQLSTAFPDVDVLVGHKVLEARARGVHKGLAVTAVRRERPASVIVAMGDEETGDDMFRALGPADVRISVGARVTGRCMLRSHIGVRQFLRRLLGS
jgi:trehalose 6-phosphate synthase/phosphatase